jgi:predicted metal-dependent phosphoesterase TrpH
MTHKINVDLHCHTVSSRDSSISLDALIKECDRKGLAKIAITDHNRIDGALEAASRWPERIIPGIEIMTRQGELLGYYVHKHIPSGLTSFETIMALKAQGSLISVSHPFDRWRNGGWKKTDLLEIITQIDAIEIFNAHCFSNKPNQQAATFSIQYCLAGTAGSDAHSINELGQAGLTMDNFNNLQEFRQALKTAKVIGIRSRMGTRIINRISRSMR